MGRWRPPSGWPLLRRNEIVVLHRVLGGAIGGAAEWGARRAVREVAGGAGRPAMQVRKCQTRPIPYRDAMPLATLPSTEAYGRNAHPNPEITDGTASTCGVSRR